MEKIERLQAYLEAERAILTGAQSYQIGSRTLTRANLSEIRAAIKDLQDEIALEQMGRGRQKRVVFIE